VLSTYPVALRQAALALKRQHPHWGPASVRLALQQQQAWTDQPLPSVARFAALFKAACPEAVQAHGHSPYPEHAPLPVTQPHQRWQMDAKEALRVGDHAYATVLSVRDPFTALIIASQAFLTTSAKGWRKLTLQEVQATLRQAFTAWGLPAQIQTDHEVVYTGAAERAFPSLFTLWLVGLGMTHVTSRSHRPTDQAQIERTHRTIGDLGWKDEPCTDLAQLQALLDRTRRCYNEVYPVQAATCHGRPPLQVYPNARHTGRPFHPALEAQLFALTRVDAFLAQQLWTRQVNETGVVSLAGEHYYLGRTYQQQTVAIQFCPAQRLFQFATLTGTLITQLPAKHLTQTDIMGPTQADLPLAQPVQLPLPFPWV